MSDITENNTENKEADKPVPGTPEYDQATADAYRTRMTGPADDDPPDAKKEAPAIPAIPEGGSEKFYDKKTGAYNWQGHAKEAEYRLTQAKGDKPAEKEGGAEKKGNESESAEGGDAEVVDVIQKAGLTIDGLRDQILSTGALDEKAMESLTKSGLPRDLVEEYVAMAKFKVETTTAKAIDYAGGKGEWDAMNEWAAKNLNEADKAEVNRLLRSDAWQTGIDIIRAKHVASKQIAGEPNLVGGDVNSPTPTGYRSKAEMKRDMQDPRYRDQHKRDPAFVRAVQQKMATATWDLDRNFD